MASPHVAGTAALVLWGGISDANGNGRVNDEVMSRLCQTAEPAGYLPAGASYQEWYGCGIVSADNATGTTTGPTPTPTPSPTASELTPTLPGTNTPTATTSSTALPTDTATATPTETPTATPSPTPTATNTASPPSTNTPVPSVSVISVAPNGGGRNQQLTVRVTGSGFQSGATADFGQRIMVRRAVFVSATALDVQVKVHQQAPVGPRDVRVTNPNGSTGMLVGGFTVN
jgi:hypothetical protein